MGNININTFPYYDDFNPEKGFHRILFKPGFAVQARELTQVQTILQEQIRRFGDHIFKDGSVVVGCAESFNFSFPYVKVTDTDSFGGSVTDELLESQEGFTVTGENFGVQAKIKKVATGDEGNSPNLKTLYVQYTSTGADNETVKFGVGETLTVLETGQTFVVAGSAETPTGFGSLFSVDNGIVYADGSFIVHNNQTVIIDRYSSSPTSKIGFVVNENIVNSDDDESLFDPAQGSSNFTAPGADRYQLVTELVSVAEGEEFPEGFYILFDVEDGRIKRRYNATQYAELNKTLARRTYDESGDYTVRPFPLILREHLNIDGNGGRYVEADGGDAGKLVVGVEPGKAYVKGFEHELFATEYLPISKAFGTGHEVTRQNQPITTGYGSYVVVNSVAGIWPINSADTVNLRNAGTTIIGTARVRDIQFIGSSSYNLYLYDITMTGAFADVRTITYGSTTTATIVTTPAVLQESGEAVAVFESPYENIKTITDASYVYRKVISGISASGTAVSASVTGEAWAFTSAVVSSNRSNDVMVVRESNGVILGITAATVTGTTLNITLQSSLGGATNVTVIGLVRKTITQNNKTLRTGRYVKINTASHTNGATGPYSLGTYDVFAIEKVWQATSSGGGDTTYPADPDSDNNWTDVTSQFVLDSGMRDATYGLGFVTPLVSQTSKKLIIKFSYLEHGTGSGYYSVDSYPLPAESDAPTSSEIAWEDIPEFVSTLGRTYDLRNCIDFRPTSSLTATDSTTVAGASTNPAATTTTFLTGFTHAASGDEFIGDVTSHLPRIDRIILDAEGTFSVITGVPSENPTRPRQPENAMTLGFVSVAPFPSLAPNMAKLAGKPQYACRISLVDNRRFTMRDIGEIHRRIDRLEYYTSLSLLEQNTANLLIANNSGEDRFKNGILVDSFIGHNIGNVYDPAYKCSIADGILRPFYLIDNIDFTASGFSNVVTKAQDAAIVVRQIASAASYTVGSTVTSSSSATGVIEHVVLVASTPGYRWVRLYLNNVSGTFGENNTITQGSATGIVTYDQLQTTVLATSLRPDLVKVAESGKLATLPYTHRAFAQNPYASKTRNAVSQLLFSYTGTLSLTPSVDIWTDTVRLPELQVNIEGTADNWEALENAWGTEWGSWEDVWQGVTTETSTTSEFIGNTEIQNRQTVETTTQRQERIGTGINVETRQVRTDLGSRVVSSNLVPFMRSTLITFRGDRMKPNTRVYAFFDNTNVSEHCRTGSNAFGTPLIVGADGTITGQFRIPAGTFTVGTKAFTLIDNPFTPLLRSNYTMATTQFTASGLSVVEQGTVISTQVPNITFNRQVQTRDVVSRVVGQTTTTLEPPLDFAPADDDGIIPNLPPLPFRSFGDIIVGDPNVNGEGTDPIAQTFIVADNNNGILLSKVDVFFKTKSLSSPITLEIREVVNGYPGETILPYSSVTLHPKDVNVSDTATAPTPFVFSSPVYLKNDTEYCFVLLPAGNDENYEVWVSELGENQIGTTQRIDKQPYSGVLFVSGNNRTWNAIQSEDMKFTMYRCEFDVDDVGVLTLTNKPTDFLTLSSVDGMNVGDTLLYTTSGVETGRGTIRFLNTTDNTTQMTPVSGTVVDGQTAVRQFAALTGTVSTSAPSTLLGVGTDFTTEVEVGDLLMYNGNIIGEVDSVDSATEITLVGTLGVTFTGQTIYNTAQYTVSDVADKSVTAISPTLGFLDFNNTTLNWEYKIHSALGVDPVSYTPLDVSGTTELLTERKVFSTTTTPNTFVIRGALGTDETNISPVIDLEKLGCVILSNSVNNDATGETGNSGNAISKYISRRVVLNDGQESEDLQVYLTSNVPSGASVKVYAKLLNDTDPSSFESRPWLEMTETGPVNNTGFKEYLYTLPTGNGSTLAGSLTGTGYEYSSIYEGFKTFAIKIVLLSSNPASIPTIRDMRAIALLL